MVATSFASESLLGIENPFDFTLIMHKIRLMSILMYLFHWASVSLREMPSFYVEKRLLKSEANKCQFIMEAYGNITYFHPISDEVS